MELRIRLSTFGLIFLLAALGELIQTVDAYKSIRPYKYYRPRPRGHKPRWHQSSWPSRYRHLKKGPPKPHYRSPKGDWKAPRYAEDHVDDDQSYTIEIELPKQLRGFSPINDPYRRNYIREADHDHFDADDDYLDEDEEFEERVLQTGKKKVHIKVVKGIAPKLKIRISRADNFAEVTDAAASSIVGSNLQRVSSLPLKNFGEIIDGEWMPAHPVPSFPEALRGA